MPETGKAKVRGNSKPNVKRRGTTYTYYVYVAGPERMSRFVLKFGGDPVLAQAT